MASPPPPEELPPQEPHEQCDICGRVARKIIWGNSESLNENQHPEPDLSIAEQSTSQEHPGRKRKLCSRCYSRFCRIHQSSMKAKQATLDLLVSWRRGRSRDAAGETDTFIKTEPVEPEDLWDDFDNIPEDLSNFEIAMSGIEQDIFSESDAPSKQNRLSELFGWGKWKLSSSKIDSRVGNHLFNTKSPNPVPISPVWKCHLCNNTSKDKRTAEKHVREMHNAIPAIALPSRVKNESLREMLILERHENHAPRKTFECPMCTESYEDKFKLLKHLTQAVKKNVCRVCKTSCEKPQEKDYHKSQHKSKVPGPKCIRCHGNFSDHIFFSAHREYCDKNPPQEIKHWSGLLSCRLCKRTNVHIDDIPEHLLRHRGTCRICLRNYERTHELEVHSVAVHKIEIFHCDLCPDIFTTSQNLNEHYMTHTTGTIPALFRRVWPENMSTGEGLESGYPLTCVECCLVFFKNEYYFRHLEDCHVEQYPTVHLPIENEIQVEQNIPTTRATASSSCTDSKKDMKLKLLKLNSYTHQNDLQYHVPNMHDGIERQVDVNGLRNWQTLPYIAPEVVPEELVPKLPPNDAYCALCHRTFKNVSGFRIHYAKMHNPKNTVRKRERPNTPSRNTSVQQEAAFNANYTNEPEQKYRPAGKRPNLRCAPLNNNPQPEQNWPLFNDTQPRHDNEQQMPITQRNYAHEQVCHQDDESFRTCWICNKVMATVKGLSRHVAWHKRINWTGNLPLPNTGQTTATLVKQEQPIAEQRRMRTRSDAVYNVNVDNAGPSFRLLREGNTSGVNHNPPEDIRMPNVAIDYSVKSYQTKDEYVNDETSSQSPDYRRFRNNFAANDAVWKCNKCKVQVPSEALFQEHKLMHANADRQSAMSGGSSSETDRTTIHRRNTMLVFECNICRDKFFQKRALTNHESSHLTNQIDMYNDGGKFNCMYCDARIKGDKAIMTHLNTHGIQTKRLINAKKLPKSL